MNTATDWLYLDYAATTPVDREVAAILSALLTEDADFANPSAVHIAGRRAGVHVARAAAQLAALVNCRPDRLIWTSGATESNNLAIIGAARYRSDRGRHLVTMPTEHKAVTDVYRALERQGFDVTWIEPGSDGVLDPADFEAALREDTQLASIMHVNNETGVIQDIDAIGAICRARGILFHVDAAQSLGKLPIDLDTQPIDLLSASAHKIYGPAGVGLLYLADRPACHVEALTYGGAQQRGIRPGTLPVPLIAAFGKAAEIAAARMDEDYRQLRRLRDSLWAGIRDVAGLHRNGSGTRSFPGILNVSVDDIEGESLLLALEPLCVATGSACNSRDREPSYVLRALGLSDALAQSAVRFSFGRMTRPADIDFAAARYRDAVARLRRLAPARAA